MSGKFWQQLIKESKTMYKLRPVPFWLVFLFYPACAVVYEIQVAKLVTWWWVQLLQMRPPMVTVEEGLINFTLTLAVTVVAVPHFLWFPMVLFKEIMEYYERKGEEEVDVEWHPKPFVIRS